jgi:hypothetical protein
LCQHQTVSAHINTHFFVPLTLSEETTDGKAHRPIHP